MVAHPDLDAEQEYLDAAYGRLEAMREAVRSRISAVLELGKGGTHQAREERDVIVRTGLQRLEQLDIGRESLCFGRIDEAAGEGSGGEAFYIGRLAVSAADQEPLVVDWRAPIAEPFYRATGRYPMGLRRRRHFATDGARLLGIEDELFRIDGPAGGDDDESTVVGPGALLAALERSRSGHMRDIVATVQREQDEIIRASLGDVLVVQGGPGTGKTAVALHRAAYLLYTHRFPLERQGVLVVGPNPVFLRYIDQVLPSLGESGVVLTTIEGLVANARARATEDADVATLKGELRAGRLLARAVRDRQRPPREDLIVPYGAYRLRVPAARLAAIVTATRRRPGPHNNRRRVVQAHVFSEIYQAYRTATGRRPRPHQDEVAEITLEEFGTEIRRLPEVREAMERMWPRLTPNQLLHDLFGAVPLLRSAGRGVFSVEELARLYRPRSARVEEVEWTAADAPLLDEARLLLGPVKAGSEELRTYGHIVVDEAQDLSAMQLRMLARRSISGSMTVVGDIAQATGMHAPHGWDEIIRHLPSRRPARIVELSVNYRTPAEIVDLAGRVLAVAAPSLRPPRSVRSTGQEPEVVTSPPGALVTIVAARAAAELEKIGEGTVAVITPVSLLEATGLALTAAGLPWGDAAVEGLDHPITVVTPGLVKGLEFDSVIVAEPARIISEAAQGLRSLYVALTRPTRRLVIVHTDALPPALADAAASS